MALYICFLKAARFRWRSEAGLFQSLNAIRGNVEDVFTGEVSEMLGEFDNIMQTMADSGVLNEGDVSRQLSKATNRAGSELDQQLANFLHSAFWRTLEMKRSKKWPFYRWGPADPAHDQMDRLLRLLIRSVPAQVNGERYSPPMGLYLYNGAGLEKVAQFVQSGRGDDWWPSFHAELAQARKKKWDLLVGI